MIALRPPAPGEVSYRGHSQGPGGDRLVTVERDGQILGVLRHIPRHSPTGMSWSYAGSGPADLALSLLADALGEDARCATCAGRGRLALSRAEDQTEVVEPYDPGRHHPVGGDKGGEDGWEVTGCWDCEDGLAPLPYQALKFDLVAALPEGGWVLARGQLLDWVAARAADPA